MVRNKVVKKPIQDQFMSIPAIDLPKRTKNCSSCKFLRYGMCPFFGYPKDKDNIAIADNNCPKHKFTIQGDEF